MAATAFQKSIDFVRRGIQVYLAVDLGAESGRVMAVIWNGKKIRLMPRAITCAPANVFQAETILKSALRTGTANNDVNPIITMKLLSEGQYNMSRLTSNTAWWVNTDAPEGLKLMMRRGLKRSMEGDFETDTMRFTATERYWPSWTDPRGAYGTPVL